MTPWLNFLNPGRFAAQRRKQGLYDQKTYNLYKRWAWSSLRARIQWCKFALEYQGGLPERAVLGEKILAAELGERLLFDALNCSLAAGLEPAIDSGALLRHTDKLISVAGHSPAIASWLQRKGIELPTEARQLAVVDQQQMAWRNDFLTHVLKSSKNLCVVGNAGVLEGSALADVIDAHDYVFRFNHFAPEESSARRALQRDTGTRLSGWVAAPNLSPPFYGTETARWLLLSGPDIRYRLFDWNKWLGFLVRDIPLITFPLSTWSWLVQQLKAPPSAGLLFLAWLLEHAGSDSSVNIAGFQLEAIADRYHLVLKNHQAVTRHNWEGERVLIRKWLNEKRVSVL